jgi:hypothetical protein
MVREAAMRLGVASVRELQQVTGLIGKRGWARVYRAMGELRKAGWLVRVGYGLYAYQEIEPRKHETLKRIWSTVRHLRKFTAIKVRLLSGASSDHVKKYITHLRRLGYIQPAGARRSQGRMPRPPSISS